MRTATSPRTHASGYPGRDRTTVTQPDAAQSAPEAATDSNVRYLEDLCVGTSWRTRGRTITEADLVTFGTWSGDMHPLHTDEEYARQTQFGGRIFHGPGALAIAFGLEMGLGWKLGSALAFLGIREWNLLAPVRVGDTLHVREEVVDIRPSVSKPDRGVVITKVQVLNQEGVVCQEGLWVVLLATRPG
jgi:acyl dehydratase